MQSALEQARSVLARLERDWQEREGECARIKAGNEVQTEEMTRLRQQLRALEHVSSPRLPACPSSTCLAAGHPSHACAAAAQARRVRVPGALSLFDAGGRRHSAGERLAGAPTRVAAAEEAIPHTSCGATMRW